MTPITPLEQRIINVAEELGLLGELCNCVEWDPDLGRVREHFRVKWDVLQLVRRITDGMPGGGAVPAQTLNEPADEPVERATVGCFEGGRRAAQAVALGKSIGQEPAQPSVGAVASPVATDRGPWVVQRWPDNRVVLQSDDFGHDAALVVTGDFGSDEERLEYATGLAAQLNAAIRV